MRNNSQRKNSNHHNKRGIFKYSLIASAIVGLSSTAVQAEEKIKQEDIEVIEVKGQRGNLISAQNMKMEADTVIDAISAEDMGSLPDRSVLEAISRMPGVAIERFAAADDPDHFGVEGGGVVVRGLTHVRSEFNARDTFSADSGRGLSFEDVSPELMGSVEIYKNQTADMIEGGIAGTVNLNTRKAFDADGRVFAFSADATYTDLREQTSPTFSALYSDIWQLDSGRLGFLVNYSNSEMKVESNGVQVGLYEMQSWDNSKFIPRSTRLSKKLDDRTREGFATSLQWENTDRTILLTGEYIRSEAGLSWGESVMEMDDSDSHSNMLPVAGTEFEFDENGYFESGVITSEAGWRGDGNPQRYGMQHNMQSRSRIEESIVNDYSFNVKYTPNDSWAFNFDIQYVDSTMEIEDVSLMGATRAVVGMDLTGSSVADITLYHPGYDGEGSDTSANPFTDPTKHFFRSAMDHVSDNEGDEFASQLDAEYTFDEGVIKSVQFGVRYSDREQTTRQSDYNWGVLSEAWAGGNIWYSDTDVPHETVSFDNFARGGVLSMEGGNAFIFPSMDLVRDYRNLNASLANAKAVDWGWNPLADRGDTTGGFIPNEINDTQEKSTAAYVRFDFEGDIDGLDYSANVGLRYVKLENDTAGFIIYPDNVPEDPVDNGDGTVTIDGDFYRVADQKAFGNGGSESQIASSEYTNILPSVNFKLNLTDELLLRFGFSEAIALPSLGNLRNYVDITGEDNVITYGSDINPETGQPDIVSMAYDRYTANSGNPYLKPMESYNYDLSLEWYFAEAGSLTFSLFYKDLSNYFINGVTIRDYTNNGATQQVQVSGATNGDKGTIKGYEIAYQQFFDTLPGALSGLGIQLNYTHINEDGSPNAGLNDSNPDSSEAADFAFDDLPLEGLSEKNANAALLYEKNGFSGRIAYNWRSEYLLTTRDVITTLPIYNQANGQLDASLFWDVTENWKLGIQGTNLNNNITETMMQINQAGDKKTRSWFTNDRRYSFVVRGTF
ncbi:TonB-dependent receptor [Thalassotalea castellviae]|uniref:TonB-dependent receptor n=1 Tax=Thalassotalea castellviae TaxID=3075612 RepID=A0ABU3A2G8_9GAMM|nr:TonB-dependent receptor [Thalassotalea sp. W431]MDT0604375.1 TonB-dependent receptor [Thalassotalea sp. W431]